MPYVWDAVVGSWLYLAGVCGPFLYPFTTHIAVVAILSVAIGVSILEAFGSSWRMVVVLLPICLALNLDITYAQIHHLTLHVG